MPDPGLYPIQPKSRSWHLDQERPKPQLRVSRFQVPLAPAYAITAHASQGQTLRAAILDLQLGRGVSAIASYVAMTRIRKLEDLLVFRDFNREVFTQGPLEGPTLLLRKLRGENIDWEAIEEKYTPKRLCHGPCNSVRLKHEFAEKELQFSKDDPVCKACTKKYKEQGAPHRCTRCRAWYATDEFKVKQVQRAVCRQCSQKTDCANVGSATE